MPYIMGGLALYNVFKSDRSGDVAGKDTTEAPTFDETKGYDPNRFEYGGQPGLGQSTADRYRMQAEQAQGRAAPQGQYQYAQPDSTQADQASALGGYSRTAEGNMAQLMAARARGETPSIASMQARTDMAHVQAAQAAQAASARGAAGVALAGQSAANNTANAQSAISNQAQINAANERMQAERGATDAFHAMRTGDQASQAQAWLQAQQRAELGTKQIGANADLSLAQGKQNDVYSSQMTDDERAVRDAQMKGNLAQQTALAGSQAQAAKAHTDAGAANSAHEHDYVVQGASNAAKQQYSTPDGEAKGGPIVMGTPYLVGEEGRELVVPRGHASFAPFLVGKSGPEHIVPQHDGTVIPAAGTAALLRGGLRARAAGGPMTGVRMLSPQKAGPIPIAGQPKMPALVRGGKGKAAAKPVATMPLTSSTGTRPRAPDDEPAPQAAGPTPAEQWDGNSTFLQTPQERRTDMMRASPAHDWLARTMGQAPAQAPEADPGAEDAPAPEGRAASPAEQRAFENKLTGTAPTLEDSNAAEADKIRAHFEADQQKADATARWEQSFGKSSDASAGARGDAPVSPTGAEKHAHRPVPLWQRAISVLGVHAREDGGPVKGVRVVSKPGLRVTSSDEPLADTPDAQDMKVTSKPGFRVTSSDKPIPGAPREMTSFARNDAGKEAERLALAESAKRDAASSDAGPLAYLPSVTPSDVRGAVSGYRAKTMDTSYKPGEATYRDPRTGETHGEEAEQARQATAAGGLVSALYNPGSAIIQAGVDAGKDAAELKRRALLGLVRGGAKK